MRKIVSFLSAKKLSRSQINAGASTAEYILRALVLLVSTPIFFRVLGAELFGVWILVNTILGFSGLFKFGMGQATVKYVSQYRAEGDQAALVKVVRTTLSMYLVLGLVGGVLICLLAPWFTTSAFKISDEYREVAKHCLMVAGLGYPVTLMQDALESVYRGYERFDQLAVVNFSFVLISNIARIGLVLAGVALPWIVLTTVALILAFCFVRMLHLRAKFGKHLNFAPTFQLKGQQEVFSYGFYSWFTSLMGIALQRGDVLIISTILGPAALPPYTIALRLLEQTHALLAKASQFLFPAFSRLCASRNSDGLQRQFNKATGVVTILSSAMIVPLFAYADSILSLWINEDLAVKATPLLQLMALRYAVYPLSIVNAYLLQGVGKVRVMAFVMMVNSIMILGGMILLIRILGLEGVAIAHCTVFLSLLFTRSYISYSIFGRLSLLRELMVILPIVLLMFSVVLIGVPTVSGLFSLVCWCAVLSLASAGIAWLLSNVFTSILSLVNFGEYATWRLKKF